MVFLTMDLAICRPTSRALATKNGIFILVMNGCTTTVALVIISCQYTVNNMYEAIANGNESSVKNCDAHSGYSWAAGEKFKL